MEFLVLVSGLVGIAVAVSPYAIEVVGVSLNLLFIPILASFMLYSALAYGRISKGSADVAFEMRTVTRYFAILLAFVVGESFAEAMGEGLSLPPGSMTLIAYFIGAYLVFVIPALFALNGAFRPPDDS